MEITASPKNTSSEHIPSAFDKWGGRKFFITLLVFLFTSVLTAFKILDSGIYKDICLYILAIYVAGNVVQKFTVSTSGSTSTTDTSVQAPTPPNQ